MDAETVYEAAMALPYFEKLKLYWMLERDFKEINNQNVMDSIVRPTKEGMFNHLRELVKAKENWREVAFKSPFIKRSGL